MKSSEAKNIADLFNQEIDLEYIYKLIHKSSTKGKYYVDIGGILKVNFVKDLIDNGYKVSERFNKNTKCYVVRIMWGQYEHF